MFKLLIVDDEYLERSALKFIIKNNCRRIAEIEEAANGKEAIEKASSFQPDIILMDIKMPGINGIEAAKTIRQYFPKCRITLLTAFDYFDYAKEAIKIGVEDFIVKPATNEQVIEAVERSICHLEIERDSISRQMETENKLGQVTQFLEYELVSSVVNGDFDENQIKEYFSVMNMSFTGGFTIAAEIDFNSGASKIYSQPQKDMIKKRYMEKLKQELQKHGCKSLAAHIGNMIYILVFTEKMQSYLDEEKDAFKIVNEVYKTAHEQLGINMNIGLGRMTYDHNSLHEAFVEAKAACRIRNKDANVISYSESDKTRNIEYPSEKEEKLCDTILACNEAEAFAMIEEMVEWMTTNIDSFDAIRWRACELLIVVFRFISREYRILCKETQTIYQELQLIESTGELKKYLMREIKAAISGISGKRTDRSGILIDKVCEYIKANYRNDLSLEEAAGMVGLSNFYFSKVFKLYKNMNFTDYITEIRINKAKELLKNPVINIKDIGELIGYSDANYFTRVFKKTEGITPTEYRSKKML